MNRSTRIAILGSVLLVWLWAGLAQAATPGAGTVTQATPIVTWTGPIKPATATSTCNGPADPACDNFQLTVIPPSPSFGPYQVEVILTPQLAGDWDTQLYRADGTVADGSGNSPGQPERMVLVNPPAGTYTVAAAPYSPMIGADTTSYHATAELKKLTPTTGTPGVEPVRYAAYAPDNNLGRTAGEPTCGVSWKTGNVMFQANTQTLRVSFDDCSSPAKATWVDKTAPTSVTTMDPILFTDSITGRTVVSQLITPAAAHGLAVLTVGCSLSSYTDNDGDLWIPSEGCGIPAGADHQTVGGGRYHDPLTRDPNGPVYAHAVYYCAQSGVTAYCSRSDNGGLTYGPGIPAWNTTQCGGLHGHVKVDPNDGTVYIPNKACNGKQGVVVSGDNGLTWTVGTVPDSIDGDNDPSVSIASDGTVYFAYQDGDGHPKVAVSKDKGRSWINIRDVGVPFNIQNTAFPSMIAGDPDRAAFAFLGTDTAGDYQAADFPGVWHVYVAHTYDGGDTWTTVNAAPGDPVQRGCIWMQGGSNPCRNLLDFMDVQVDKNGRAIVAYADGCIGDCVNKGPNSYTSVASLSRQTNGRRLFARADSNGAPAAPAVTAQFNTCAGQPSLVRLMWSQPEDNGSAITGYRIYRSTNGGGFVLLATVNAADSTYDDTTINPNETYVYRVTAMNAQGEGTHCGEVAPRCDNTATETPCAFPGKTILTDATGDATGGRPEHDIEKLSIVESQQLGAGKIMFVLKMAGLANPTPNTTWPVSFKVNGADCWVRMASDPQGTISFGVGTGTNPSPFVSAGVPADPSSGFSADGTIRIVVPRTAIGNVLPGQLIEQFLVRIRIEAALAGAVTPDNMPGTTGGGSYSLVGSENCGGAVPTARDDEASTTQDFPVVVNVLANDSDGGAAPLTVVSVGQPSNGSAVNNGDGTVTYTPTSGFIGSDSFSYTIRNAQGGSSSATVRVTVNPGCPLVAKGKFEDTLEPEAKDGWTVNTVSNNLGPASLTWQVLPDASAHSAINSWFSDATTLDVKDDRLVMPTLNLSPASQLVFWHRYQFESGFDGGVLEVSRDGNTWIDVVEGGGSFVEGGYDGAISAQYGSPIAGRAAWTGGPDDAALAPMTKVVVNLGAFAGIGVRIRFRLGADQLAPGALPGQGWWIDDLQVTNTLIPGPCNRAPVANDDTAGTTENIPVEVDVLANDSDPDSDPLSVDSVTQAANGAVANNGSNVTYTPNTNFVGTDTFSYTASDGKGGTDTATVNVVVNQRPNKAPVAGDDNATTVEDKAVSISVLNNDSDADNDPLTVSSVTQAGHGIVTHNSNTVTYTPNAGFTGADSFTYTVTDGRGGSDTASVTVTVTPAPNHAPVANDDAATTTEETAVVINVLANDTDADGDTVSIASFTQPAHGSVTRDVNGLKYTPAHDFEGTDSFTYTVSDGRGGSDNATVTVRTTDGPSRPESKAEGSGWISAGSNQKSEFNFNAKYEDSGLKGKISFKAADRELNVKGPIESLTISGKLADFSGSCTINERTPCRFAAHAEDRGEPGTGNDRFSLQVFDATGAVIYSADATLGGGNIKVH